MTSTDQTEKPALVLPIEDDESQGAKTSSNGALGRVASSTSEVPYSVFTENQKRFVVFTASWAGFFSPVSSQIYFPALNTLANDLHVSNSLINLTLTSYMVRNCIRFVGIIMLIVVLGLPGFVTNVHR